MRGFGAAVGVLGALLIATTGAEAATPPPGAAISSNLEYVTRVPGTKPGAAQGGSRRPDSGPISRASPFPRTHSVMGIRTPPRSLPLLLALIALPAGANRWLPVVEGPARAVYLDVAGLVREGTLVRTWMREVYTQEQCDFDLRSGATLAPTTSAPATTAPPTTGES